jgi:RND family efflux transporter MFP subunit
VRTIVVGIVAVLGTAACGGAKPDAPPLPVTVMQVSGSGAGGGLRYSAGIVPDVQVDVAFRVGGYVEEVLQVRGADGRMRNVQDGDFVRRGTVLARLRLREYRDAQLQAEASLRQAQADFGRVSQLFENRSASRADYDAAYARFQATQAQVDQATQSLADCSLRAPMDGFVMRRSVEVGALAAVGAPAFSIGDVRSVKVVFGVPDVLVGSMRLGAPQNVTIEAVPGQVFHGRFTRVAPSADPSSRVFEVEVTIPNADGHLRSGMIASLEVAGAAAARPSPTMFVPLNAVVRPPGEVTGYAVYVVAERAGRTLASLRRVSLGDINGNMIGVTGGLGGGDRVIVRGATLAVDSQAVRIVP